MAQAVVFSKRPPIVDDSNKLEPDLLAKVVVREKERGAFGGESEQIGGVGRVGWG